MSETAIDFEMAAENAMAAKAELDYARDDVTRCREKLDAAISRHASAHAAWIAAKSELEQSLFADYDYDFAPSVYAQAKAQRDTDATHAPYGCDHATGTCNADETTPDEGVSA